MTTKTVKKRARTKTGKYVKDDPKTSTNEAWTYTGPTYMWIAHAVEDKVRKSLEKTHKCHL